MVSQGAIQEMQRLSSSDVLENSIWLANKLIGSNGTGVSTPFRLASAHAGQVVLLVADKHVNWTCSEQRAVREAAADAT